MQDPVSALLEAISIPPMAEITQTFERSPLRDGCALLIEEFRRSGAGDAIQSGMNIAITAGSRGITNIAAITKAAGDLIKSRGANPFVVPAMGSHGGATAAGQKKLLSEYGITEQEVGMPIKSSMEVVKVGELSDGAPVYFDKFAYDADGVVLLNRIKVHTAFRARYESGLMKILTVGLGKQMGADVYHGKGLDHLPLYIEEAGKFLLNRVNVIMGIAILENAYEETGSVRVLRKGEIAEEEPELLKLSKEMMPCIKFKDLDVLIIDEIGKNFSGAGMDPNITGKYINSSIQSTPIAKQIVVLDLSEETHGNGNGIGLADITTKRVLNKVDYSSMYMNGLTSGVSESSKIPMLFESDRQAIKAAIKLSKQTDFSKLRMVRVSNTLNLERIAISKGLMEEAKLRNDIIIDEVLRPVKFDHKGNLF